MINGCSMTVTETAVCTINDCSVTEREVCAIDCSMAVTGRRGRLVHITDCPLVVTDTVVS